MYGKFVKNKLYSFTGWCEMSFEKILVLNAKGSSIEGKFLEKKGINVEHIWKKDHFSNRKYTVLKLFNMHHLLYGFKKEQIEKYNKIILSETSKMSVVAQTILKWNPQVDLKVYMWNIVRSSSINEVKALQNLGVEVYTFDKQDCEKYGLKYNPQMYPFDIDKVKDVNIKYQCYFCAADKERINDLIELKRYLDKNNISYKFRVLLKKHKKYNFNKNEVSNIIFMQKSIQYNQILEELQSANCIVEIVQKGQIGFTWRVHESLFYDKKLITNNKTLKEYEFYNPSNIFIIDNNYDKIKDFLNIPYEQVDNRTKNKYTYEVWLSNFFN